MNEVRDLLIYVHVPFCQSKCHFCDWVTGIPAHDLKLGARSPRRQDYIAALVRQILDTGGGLADQGYRARILYWGGGTASALEPDELERIAGALRAAFDLSDLVEATLECSPETLTPAKLALARDLGFTRLSIGIQSLDDNRLRAIGRAHDSAQAVASVHMAARAGFDDVNIDLISGFPDETVEEFDTSLDRVLDLPFNHCSLYPYRPAPGTVMLRSLGRHRTARTWLEEQLEAYEVGRARLEARGLREYAFSHFGHPPCRSDLAYFRLDMDWFGFGSGATSIVGGRYRATERTGMSRFIEAPGGSDEDVAAASPAVAGRLAYQALTLPEGIRRQQWEERLRSSLETVLTLGPVRGLLDYFDRTVSLIRDDCSIRLPADRIASAFITLLFLNNPATAQRRTAAQSAVGGY